MKPVVVIILKKTKTIEMNQERVQLRLEAADQEEDLLDPKTSQNHPFS